MPYLNCTGRLHGVGPATTVTYPGSSVAELLEHLWEDYPQLRGYVLDDQGRVRKHVALFVDGQLQPRERALDVALTPDSDIYVMQALSGG